MSYINSVLANKPWLEKAIRDYIYATDHIIRHRKNLRILLAPYGIRVRDALKWYYGE